MKKAIYVFIAIVAFCSGAVAQVSSDPSPIPVGYKGQIVLTYDPSIGTGEMMKATECYSHIGLITSKSKDITDWQYIKTGKDNWGTKLEPKWTKVGSKWQLTIDNMYTFFGCPESETISYIVMVFHDGNGSSSKQGKSSSTSNGDILVGVGQVVQDDIWKDFTPAACQTASRPSGVVNGIYYGSDGTSVTLCTYAASKTAPAKHVFLLGDMTNWRLSNDYQLKRDGNYFWIKLTGLEKGKEYRFQYAVVRDDGKKVQLSDLFSEKVLTMDDNYDPKRVDPDLIGYPMVGANGYVTVIQPGKTAYQWSEATKTFKRPDKNNLIIYEVWVYDHTAQRSLPGMMERLDYIKNLGVNCVELMPVNEFDGNQSWGYSPNHYFALDKAYGKPEHLKAFVDECHKRGIAVVLDMVFNHATGNNPMNKLYPWTSKTTSSDLTKNPWFNYSAPHADNVYDDWNHGFAPAQDMFRRALKYWMQEYKVDGYRMDLSHGLCDSVANTSVKHITDYYNAVKEVTSDAYFMLEHWGGSMGSERPQLVNAGMMCWENTSNAFEQVTMGWLKDGDGLDNANMDNYVSYCENHDEERCFFKAKQWGDGPSSGATMQKDEAVRAARIPLVLGFQAMLNGPQLFYHFAEIGFDNSKFQDDKGRWGTDGVEKYGKGISTDTVGWEVKMSTKKSAVNAGWFKAGSRMQGYQRLAQIIQLRTRLLPDVFKGNPTSSYTGGGASVRYVQWGSDVVAVANFSAKDASDYTLPAGTWYDYLDGGGKAEAKYTLQPGQIKVFTGKQISAPEIPDHYDFEEFTGIEEVDYVPSFSRSEITKFMQDGQVYISLPNGAVYDMFGRRIR